MQHELAGVVGEADRYLDGFGGADIDGVFPARVEGPGGRLLREMTWNGSRWTWTGWWKSVMKRQISTVPRRGFANARPGS